MKYKHLNKFMKFSLEVEINKPVDELIKLWTNENNYKIWQYGFQSIEHIEGEAGTIGAKSKIIIQQERKKIELTETIITNNLPFEKKALYEHNHMSNIQVTRFHSISEYKTQYISEYEYIKFNGIIPKLMAIFFSGMFRKQALQWMYNFKKFAEEN